MNHLNILKLEKESTHSSQVISFLSKQAQAYKLSLF